MHIEKIQPVKHQTELIGFEDTMLFQDHKENSLIYRYENPKAIMRHTTLPDRHLSMGPGPVKLTHTARYERPVLKLQMRLVSGSARVLAAMNGTNGFAITLHPSRTDVTRLSDGQQLASIPAGIGTGADFQQVSVGWDCDTGTLTVSLPSGSYRLSLPKGSIKPGGFGLSAPGSHDRFDVQSIKVVWQDDRQCYYYDTYDKLYNTDTGRLEHTLPPPQLPEGWTHYSTVTIDVLRRYTLLVCGFKDLDSNYPATLKGYCLRELNTGKCQKLSDDLLKLHPVQGGGSIEGLWLLQSWINPASLTWIDWSAYHKGDMSAFATPCYQSTRNGTKFEGFHDPTVSLDGSLMRYLYITETYRGVNRFEPVPALKQEASFQRHEIPLPPNPKLSETGPDRLISQLAHRDRDLAWYEIWAYGSSSLHQQTRGYNLWTQQNDFLGPPATDLVDGPAHTALVNLGVDLVDPGRTAGLSATFNPTKRWDHPGHLVAHGQYVLRYDAGTRRLRLGRMFPPSCWRVAQLLW
ncbi:MAG: hypothetical protein ACYC1M_05845 [Armatimonadota bacterium]